ncbi:hypothetical protein [Nonomuraea candida]|uniref:hypothetical protein n=1 Tax=Nonomuraea candida TaxID=359159 RepID=UPI0005B9A9CE|nr:hypothetical protein [Nonomuraea candida]
MSNSSTSGSDPFASAFGNAGSAFDPRTRDPEFKMRHSSVRTLGTNVSGYGEGLEQLSGQTRAIDLHTLTFGVIGGGLNVAHRNARDSAADALRQARDVLDSWRQTLKAAADNTEAAEEASKTKGGGPDMPQIKNPGGGLGGLPSGAGLGDLPKNGGLGDLGKGIKPAGLDPNEFKPDDLRPDDLNPNDLDPNGLDPNGLDPNDLDRNGVNPDDLDLDRPDPGDLNRPDLTNPDLQTPDLRQPGLDTPEVPRPDLSGLDKPTGTDLAGLNPNLPNPAAPQVRTPETPAFDPRLATPRTAVGPPDGGFGSPSSAPAASGPVSPGSIAKALNTGVPPMYPPMGMGATPNQDGKDRDRGAHAGEDESVWGLDEEAWSGTIGKEEV